MILLLISREVTGCHTRETKDGMALGVPSLSVSLSLSLSLVCLSLSVSLCVCVSLSLSLFSRVRAMSIGL
jgi:hypothetical protein